MIWIKGLREYKGSKTLLGEGISGKVELYEKGTKRYVIKTYHGKELHETRKEYRARILYEYQLLNSLQHPNIIRAFKSVVSANGLQVKVFIEAGSPDLSVLLQRHGSSLCITTLTALWKQVCEGVCYLHERELCHRDLKLENLVMNPEFTQIKIIDFMTATKCEGPVVGIVGSSRYMAPEMASRISYEGKSVDMWSLGIILYRLLSRKFPWRQAMHLDPDFKIYAETRGSGSQLSDVYGKKIGGKTHLPGWSPSFPVLMSFLLEINPSNRSTIQQVFEDEWFASIQSHC
ncbi:kinase-like protein [Metschnikowia bicuspidata var. bicuspidata NRRL YB-4993]|uniref:Kinase-like protein n=1 Tax=Metschnikowia bicuspidata var. bicuspidata NRRL YB-4993 TaxID=869754 RepID=A0A1A0H9M7_9ASCO|nr:kinase-like protein [Metschnikowia bicuspidata var. bicuspidata NRRL YB-4993]OBA20583.1 kinase-like protein [Metschnikowia bicuspidata var. bicuspidata NRRL YB-4993]